LLSGILGPLKIHSYHQNCTIDLAGSERVYKTKSDSQTLEEAKSINLSLHFLEQVVLALSEGSQRHHIPYRNSSLTALLKETLGSNCLTAMIATFSSNLNDINETISTCSFAQRVSLVQNSTGIKESCFTKDQIIQSLRNEISKLKTKLVIYEDQTLEFKSKPVAEYSEILKADLCEFVETGEIPNLKMVNLNSIGIETCLKTFRNMILENKEDSKKLIAECTAKLQLEISRKDDEIEILKNLSREKKQCTLDEISAESLNQTKNPKFAQFCQQYPPFSDIEVSKILLQKKISETTQSSNRAKELKAKVLKSELEYRRLLIGAPEN